MEVMVTTGAISRAKLQSNHHHQQTNIQFLTGRMPFLSPNQQCQSSEGKKADHQHADHQHATPHVCYLGKFGRCTSNGTGVIKEILVKNLTPMASRLLRSLKVVGCDMDCGGRSTPCEFC